MSYQRDASASGQATQRRSSAQRHHQLTIDSSLSNLLNASAMTTNEKTPLVNNSITATAAGADQLINSSVVGADLTTGVSWGMAAFLLVNTALGAGMLNYPYAYNQVGGVLAASLMQVILLFFITSTMFILVYCADFNRDDTYHDVLLSMCGKRAQQISAMSILLTCYGINVTFLVIIGDQYDRIFNSLMSPQQLETSWWLDRKFTIFLTSALFIWPMCYAKRLDFLRHASILGMFAMLYVAFLTVYEHYVLDEATIDAVVSHLQVGLSQQQQQLSAMPNQTSTSSNQLDDAPSKQMRWFEPLAVVPVLCFAYQTHEVIVPVYACMRERIIGTFMKASIFGLVILFFLYNLVGAFGYLTFGDRVGADIMSLYNAQDPVVVVGIVALVIKFITTYPPLMFCGRSALDGLYGEIRRMSPSEFKSSEPARRYVITTIWFITSVAIAIFAPDISITLQLLGSMASINVFVFPGMCLASLTTRLRRARLALLMGEPLDNCHATSASGATAAALDANGDRREQQRAKDYYLINGSYVGAIMKKNQALRNQCRQQQQQQQFQSSNCLSTGSGLASASFSNSTNPKNFTATFASLIEFEKNLTRRPVEEEEIEVENYAAAAAVGDEDELVARRGHDKELDSRREVEVRPRKSFDQQMPHAPPIPFLVGISKSTAICLHAYAALLIVFGIFIFFLELGTVFGLF